MKNGLRSARMFALCPMPPRPALSSWRWLNGCWHDVTRKVGFPHLLRIAPLFPFLGDDVSDQAAVSAFIRVGLQPLIRHYQVGEIMLHHSNKPQKDSATLSGSDYAYLGSGSMELA